MGTWAAYTDVAARIPYRTIGTSSKPTSTQVEAYITQAEHALEGALLAGGCTLPGGSDDGADVMAMWVLDYAEGMTRQAYAAAGGDGGNDDGQDLIDRFLGLLDKIRENPSWYDALLNGGDSGDSARRCLGYVLDNADEKTIADGDFDPTFTTGEEW